MEKESTKKNNNNSGRKANKKKKVTVLKQNLEAMRGQYQEASIISTRHFQTSKWVMGRMQKYGLKPKKGEQKPKVLEIGAINTQLVSCKWLNATAIDLNSQSPRIKQADFFEFPLSYDYDVLVSSMVINCVPGSKRR